MAMDRHTFKNALSAVVESLVQLTPVLELVYHGKVVELYKFGTLCATLHVPLDASPNEVVDAIVRAAQQHMPLPKLLERAIADARAANTGMLVFHIRKHDSGSLTIDDVTSERTNL